MTNHTTHNSADGEFGKIVLWQYDKAENLVALIKSFLGIHDSATKDLWDKMMTELDVDTASEFGLSILGSLLGVPWIEYDGSRMSADLYRKWIKAWAVLIRTDFTRPDVQEFFKTITYDNDDNRHVEIIDSSISEDLVMATSLCAVKRSGDSYTVSSSSSQDIESIANAVKNAVNANGHPAAVFSKDAVHDVIFGFDGQQYKEVGDEQIGGFDDSTFIPTDEYAPEG